MHTIISYKNSLLKNCLSLKFKRHGMNTFNPLLKIYILFWLIHQDYSFSHLPKTFIYPLRLFIFIYFNSNNLFNIKERDHSHADNQE